jgi:hypothetical protein
MCWIQSAERRILVQVPAVYKDSVSGWAEPCLPLVGLRGPGGAAADWRSSVGGV